MARTFVDTAPGDSLNYGNIHAFERTDPWSFACQFKTPGNNQAPGWGDLLGHRDASELGGYTIQVAAPGSIRLYMTGTSSGNRLRVKTTATIYTDDVWHHLIITIDGSSLASGVNIYVEGIAVGMTTDFDALTTSMKDETVPLILGDDLADADNEYEGELAELALWDRELRVGEAIGMGKGHQSPDHILNGLIFYPHLRGNSVRDIIGSVNPTIVGTSLHAHPRVVYPTAPYIITAPAAVAAGDVRRHIIPAYERINA